MNTVANFEDINASNRTVKTVYYTFKGYYNMYKK